MGNFALTVQQQTVTDFFKKQFVIGREKKVVSVFLNAKAGAGKTSTIMVEIEALEALEKQLQRKLLACTVSFNTNIRDASSLKLAAMGSTVQAKTTNQLGRSILVEAAKDGLCPAPGQCTKKKYNVIVEEILTPYKSNKNYFPKLREFFKAVTATCHLVEAVRSTRVEASEVNMLNIIDHYNLEDKIDITLPSWSLIVNAVPAAIKKGIDEYNKNGLHDFNDQICLPLDFDVASPMWDVIFIDEAQDLNRARLEMICKSIKPNGVLFFVGDPNQAIQGFTYADTDSVNTIKAVTNAEEFPLSVCWRCDEKIIRLAQVVVPDIQARPNAKPGTVDMIYHDRFYDMLETGYKRGNEEKDPDLVLCRVKAPLVQMCLQAIRSGKAAIVRGRDIGRNIIDLLEEIPKVPFDELGTAIEEYTDNKINKYVGKKDAEKNIAELSDRSDTLLALLDGYLYTLKAAYLADLDEFKEFIAKQFADDETADEVAKDRVKSIIFSTIHKAKGLEYDRVFILEPRLLPHPAAKAGWNMEQEYNILYVAVTRAKKSLFFVDGIPAALVDKYTEIKAEEEAIIAATAVVVEEFAPVEAPAPVAQIEEKAASKKGRKATGRVRAKKQFTLDADTIAYLKYMVEQAEAKNDSVAIDQIVQALPGFNLWKSTQGEDDNNPDNDGPGGGVPTPETAENVEWSADGNDPGASLSNIRALTHAVQSIAWEIGTVDDENEPLPAPPSTYTNGELKSTVDALECQTEQDTCVYDSNPVHVHCPKCNKPYCAECEDMFLPIDPSLPGAWEATAPKICPQCSYNRTYSDVEPQATVEPLTSIAKTVRMFFRHKYGSCKNVWTIDYLRSQDGRLYRIDTYTGEVVFFEEDPARKCAICKKNGRANYLKAKYSESHKCNDICRNATGPSCTCACGGKHHGENHMVGSIHFVGVEPQTVK